MKDFSSNDALSRKSTGPIALVSQLLQGVADMQHSDELFTWLASTMVEHFSIVSAQTWAIQAYSNGTASTKLRASASRHPFQASRVLESAEVKVFIQRMLREQRSILSVPINSMFSQRQATIFAQQDCLYWTTCFLSNDILLPPPLQKDFAREEIATPLRMIFSFFTKELIQSSNIRAIHFLLDQSLRVATNRGLLIHKESAKLEEVNQPAFGYLVPERIETKEVELTENSLYMAIVIPEKKSRQMYNLIDGKKTIDELASLIILSQKESLEILNSLLTKGYIRIREVGGKS